MKRIEIQQNGEDGQQGKNADKHPPRVEYDALYYKNVLNRPTGYDGSNGIRGLDATGPGQNGKKGGKIDVNLDFEADKGINLSYQTTHSNGQVNKKDLYHIPINEISDTAITLSARGGHGGRGGDGSNGSDGLAGSQGKNGGIQNTGALIRAGGTGGNGGIGGDGGNGSDGGNGDDGGQINIKLSSQDADLLMLFDRINVNAGDAGEGGRSGVGGKGGRGGAGGTGGNQTDGPFQFYVSWGFSGSTGADGKNGNPGKEGKKGNPGSYSIDLTDLNKSYTGQYHLSLEEFELSDSDDGVIEPGEQLSLQVTVKNTGLMPTPSKQMPQISLQNNSAINQIGSAGLISPAIEPSQSITLATPLKFSINPNLLVLQPNKISKQQVSIGINAVMPRVNKTLFSKQLQTIEVRYPIELSTIANQTLIMQEEQAPLAIKVRNVSTGDIGQSATQPRLIQIGVKIESPYAKNMIWKSKDGNLSQSMSQEVNHTIGLLAAKSTYIFSGTLQCSDHKIPAYTIIKVTVNLALSFGNLTMPKIIQQSTCEIQIQKGYEYNPLADFILIHHNNPKEELMLWENRVASLGSSLNIWDIQFYSGVDYHHKMLDGKSILEQWKNKEVIILDKFTDQGKEKYITAEYFGPIEIYEGAKDANISTYVISSQFQLPMISHISGEPSLDVSSVFLLNNEDAVKIKAKEASKNLTEKNPHQRYVVAYHCQESSNNNKNIGKIYIRKSLDTTHAKIAVQKKPSSDDKVHIFNMVKLIPFEKKLNSLIICRNELDHVVLKAILSDLADEQHVFRQGTWNGEFPKEKLKNALPHFNRLYNYNFSTLNSHPNKREIVIELLLHIEYLIENLSSFVDVFRSSRGRTLAEVCRDLLVPALEQLNISANDRSRISTAIAQLNRGITKDELLTHYRYPSGFEIESNLHAGNTMFNHWQEAPSVMQMRVDEQPEYATTTPSYNLYSQSNVIKSHKVTQPQYVFGPEDKEKRKEAIEKFESKCNF